MDVDQTLARIADAFCAKAAGRAEIVRQAVISGDRDLLKDISHKICGTGGTLGFMDLSRKAMIVEDILDAPNDALAAAGDLAGAAEELAQELDRMAASFEGSVFRKSP